jgi:hypothetical protein
MVASAERHWDAIYRLGTDDVVDELSADVIAKLIEFKMAEISDDGSPRLTPYVDKCFLVMTSDDGVVPELNDIAAIVSRADIALSNLIPP